MKKHPLPGIYLRGSVLALAVLAGSCAARKQAANPSLTLKTITTPGGTVATATTGTPKKEGIKKFSDLIPAKTKADSGLFNTYKVDGKYYYEIPDSLINREMLVVTRFVKTPGGLKTFGQQYGGEEINNQVWKWEKHDKQVFIRVPSYSLRADSTSDMYQSVKNSNLDAILASFEVKAFNKDTTGVLIDVTDFYNGDIAAIGLSDDIKKAYKTMGVDNSRSYIDTIKSFPINIEARTLKTYRAGESPTDNSNAAITFELNTSMLLLPKVPMKARIMDPRVGFFGQRQTDYGTNAQKALVTAYIHRWRLEPKDPIAYAKGELVEPKKQIVFYIDPATPKKWVPYLIQGVNDWQKAFEAAGFKNAITAKEAPTAKQDPQFSTEDARYSVIRYFASDVENAYGPHVADPRSGEILESHVGWYHNVMQLLRDWYLIQTAAVNPKARHAQFADDQMGELIRFVSSHEVGHTLGLPHNFGSSYAYPVDSLRSKTFTDTHGTAPSIMDYARFNYIAQPGDGVTHLYPQIGEYDNWAIKWGYTWFAGNKTPEQEKETLAVWTNKNAGNPVYYFGRQGTTIDPRLQNEDLGDNAMKASAYGIANLKRILPNLEKWSYKKDEDYADLNELYNEVLGQYYRYMGHVTTNIGGMNENFKTYDQKGAVYDFVNKERQREAALFLNQQLYTTPLWLINKAELAKFDNGVMINRIKAMQVSLLGNELNPSRLARMYDNEAKNGANAYTVAQLLTDLHKGIFGTTKPDGYERNLQRGYIENLKNLLNTDASFAFPGVSSAQLASWGFTPINIALSDIRPMVRAELKKIDTGLPKGGDAITAAHYADLHLRIKEALNPTRPVVNIAGGMIRGINTPNQDILNEKTGSMNCWPRTNVEN
ncbi:zinc-dependent metalloprotease [Mucilaginibacter gossypii]|uniref:zinc-dependent metalloprotease n=1 Tax=Mucilaginibacter gossypii TaxID=551996 RepID=UPI000DCAF06B|nr:MULTISPECIES: zinc-dependent metalloprotease [Mucilaginibacter]QTE35583.1 zinc-dependent metalloprotease [Mucilaginibacter gossypii]RAV47611.1 zinc-dependent metalloprotease [Mucilaginibacter rubeus]